MNDDRTAENRRIALEWATRMFPPIQPIEAGVATREALIAARQYLAFLEDDRLAFLEDDR